MKKTILSNLFFGFVACAFAPTSFAQSLAVEVDCKISATYELAASYDSSKNILSATKKQNGETASYLGVSFEQLNKVSLNKDADILALAKAVGFSLTKVNAANRFILTQSNIDKTELVDFIDIDGESLGTAAVLGPKFQICF